MSLIERQLQYFSEKNYDNTWHDNIGSLTNEHDSG